MTPRGLRKRLPASRFRRCITIDVQRKGCVLGKKEKAAIANGAAAPAIGPEQTSQSVLRGLSVLLWRYPSLHHGAFDDVLLISFTLRASKRSQILAPHARLNHHQPHGRIAVGALRTLVLCVEHESSPRRR